MKKLLITSMLLGGLCGAGLAQAQAVIGGAVVVHDRHSNVGIYYQQPPAYAPVYYPRPRPVYYAQPVYYGPPGYYERPYRWGPPRHRHHHHHHHDRYYDRY